MANSNAALLARFHSYLGNFNASIRRSEVMRGMYPVGSRIAAFDSTLDGAPWIPGRIIGYWDSGPRVAPDDGRAPIWVSWSQISDVLPRTKNAVKRTTMLTPRNRKNHLGGSRRRHGSQTSHRKRRLE